MKCIKTSLSLIASLFIFITFSSAFAETATFTRDINTSPDYIYPYSAIGLGSRYIMQAYDGVFGNELWSSNGTSAGTIRIPIRNSGGTNPNNLTVMGSYV